MYKLLFSMISKLGFICVICYIAWLAWNYLGPCRPDIGRARVHLADTVIPHIVDKIRTSGCGVEDVALAYFVHDSSDYFSDELRFVIERNGVFVIRNRSFVETLRRFLHLRQKSCNSLDDAITYGKDRSADGVIYGCVNKFESYPNGARIDVQVSVVDVRSNTLVFSRQFVKEVSDITITSVLQHKEWWQIIKHLVWCALFVLLLPVISISFIRSMVRRDSNVVNGWVLGIYSGADGLFAIIVFAGITNGWLLCVLAAVVLLFGIMYNIRIMTFVLHMDHKLT